MPPQIGVLVGNNRRAKERRGGARSEMRVDTRATGERDSGAQALRMDSQHENGDDAHRPSRHHQDATAPHCVRTLSCLSVGGPRMQRKRAACPARQHVTSRNKVHEFTPPPPPANRGVRGRKRAVAWRCRCKEKNKQVESARLERNADQGTYVILNGQHNAGQIIK